MYYRKPTCRRFSGRETSSPDEKKRCQVLKIQKFGGQATQFPNYKLCYGSRIRRLVMLSQPHLKRYQGDRMAV